MSKKFSRYLCLWGILFVFFLLSAILLPTVLKTETKGYAVGLIGVILAFLGQLVCARKVFGQKTLHRTFRRIPMPTILYGALLCTAVIGILCMLVSFLPAWLGAALCLLILGAVLFAVVRAEATADAAQETEVPAALQTESMEMLRARAAALIGMAPDADTRAALEKVAEKLQHCEPAGTAAGMYVDAQLFVKLEDIRVYLADKVEPSFIVQMCGLMEGQIDSRNRQLFGK